MLRAGLRTDGLGVRCELVGVDNALTLMDALRNLWLAFFEACLTSLMSIWYSATSRHCLRMRSAFQKRWILTTAAMNFRWVVTERLRCALTLGCELARRSTNRLDAI